MRLNISPTKPNSPNRACYPISAKLKLLQLIDAANLIGADINWIYTYMDSWHKSKTRYQSNSLGEIKMVGDSIRVIYSNVEWYNVS